MPTINRTVLMSDAEHFRADQAINPYYGDTHVNSEQALAEHTAIRAALESAGITVHTAASPADSQDGVYTANWALVRGNDAVLARLPDVRKAEEVYAATVLRSLGKTVHVVPDNLRFSGQGDALPCGNLLFCGQGYRSDEAAQAFAADLLGYERVQLQTVPQLDSTGQPVKNAVSGWLDSFFYDIDLALAVLRHPTKEAKGLIAYCPEAFVEESRTRLEALDASFGADLVDQRRQVVVHAQDRDLGDDALVEEHSDYFPEDREDSRSTHNERLALPLRVQHLERGLAAVDVGRAKDGCDPTRSERLAQRPAPQLGAGSRGCAKRRLAHTPPQPRARKRVPSARGRLAARERARALATRAWRAWVLSSVTTPASPWWASSWCT